MHSLSSAAAPRPAELIDRLRVVCDVAAALHRETTLAAIYDHALDALVRGAGVDRASVLLFDPDGVLRFKASRGLSPEYRRAVEGHTPWRPDQLDPPPIVVPDASTSADLGTYRETILGEGIRALGFFPLSGRDQLLGKFMVYYDAPHVFAPADLEVVHAIARIVATAIERQRDADALRESEARFRDSQKLESLGVLAGGIAHDFNNLLVGVLGNASLALRALGPEHPARPAVEDIATTARRAAELTHQLLAYSGKGKFVIERIDLSALLEEMMQLLGSVVSKRAAFSPHLAAGLPRVEADATQLRQVVMNLITNASDAVAERGGVISVATGVAEIARADLAGAQVGRDSPPGTYVFLEVADSGCGMSRETVAKMFEPFYTTKFTGRGLGLAAVMGIVLGHHGALEVSSEPGRGTVFRLLLPAAGAIAVAAAAPLGPPSSPRDRGDRRLVLVIDDEPLVRNVVAAVLRDDGFTPLTADSGQAGLELFRDHPDEIGAVLLDLTMPGLSGEDTFHALRALRADVKVVLFSGYSEQELTARFAGEGLTGFLQKPFTADQLIAAVSAAAGPAAGPTA